MALLELDQVATELALNERTIRRYCQDGFLPSTRTRAASGFKYVVDEDDLLRWRREHFGNLARKLISKPNRLTKGLNKENVREHIEIWLNWCLTGQLNGKPIAPRTAEIYRYCMDMYLDLLPKGKLEHGLISIENSRHALGLIPVERYSSRINVYASICSFAKYLIEISELVPGVLEEIKRVRPKRFLPARKTVLNQIEILALIKEIDSDTNLDSYNRLLNKSIVLFLANTGLRSSEMCKLKFDDISYDKRMIFVKLGKGNKNRNIGMTNECYKILSDYTKVRLEKFRVGEYQNIFLGCLGTPFNNQTLAKKFRRMSKKYGFDITPHGLRRSFVTINARKGVPINHLRIACGHADLATTQGYCLTSEEEVIEDMRNW